VPLSLTAVTQIAVGSATSAAIRSDGTLLTWGDDNSGGLDTSACCRLSVNPVSAPATGQTFVSQIAFGEMYGIALSTLPAGLVPVPSVIGDTQAQASQDLQSVGLALCSVGSALDPACDHRSIDLVLGEGYCRC
jgi:Regulator of Chromosome Condensation (RCC1) repeat protein